MEELIGFNTTPAATSIIIITIAVSLYAFFGKTEIYETWMLSPYYMIRKKKWYLFITSGLIHGNIMHLLFNMLSYYFFGFWFEYILRTISDSKLMGSVYFVIIYFGSMILADISSVMKNRDNPDYHSLGASGAISGIIFGFILFNPMAELGLLFLPIPLPAFVFGFIYLAFSQFASHREMGNINHEAHFWGAIAGIGLTIACVPASVDIFFRQIF